jgi:hypothetical protein
MGSIDLVQFVRAAVYMGHRTLWVSSAARIDTFDKSYKRVWNLKWLP